MILVLELIMMKSIGMALRQARKIANVIIKRDTKTTVFIESNAVYIYVCVLMYALYNL